MVSRGEPDGQRATSGPAETQADTDALPEINGYELLERIGRGGMGEVYRARQLNLGRLVAIKFLMPEGQTVQGEDLARFRREAELMARVSHPNVLSIFDFGEADGQPYLVLEYVEGGDLRRRMTAGRPMPLDRARAIIVPVGQALAHLHQHGIIHRDLKPENILLQTDGHPRVTDFGIAIVHAGVKLPVGTTQAAGTVGYIAPEQQYRLKVDERADQYSLAAVAYELLTGQPPLGIFKPPSQLNSSVTAELDEVILRALQENPKDRFATVPEFLEAFERAVGGALARRGRRGGWFALGMTGVIAATIVALTSLPIRPDRRIPERAAVRPSPPVAATIRIAEPHAAVISQERSPALESPQKTKQELLRATKVLSEQLKRIRAERIWRERGKPTGAEGEKAKDEIWFEAERKLDEELKLLAYRIWQERGGPTGVEGERVRDEVWFEAQRRLYKEWTGKHWGESESQ